MKSDKVDIVTIALDSMGGDNAPESVIHGANLALARSPHVKYIIYGDEQQIKPWLKTFPDVATRCELIHTDKVISDHAKPSAAFRTGRDSSMALAILAVKEKRAQAIVSSGNTGALMAIAKLNLGTLPGVNRPAISGILPSLKNKVVMLDLGANATVSAENLFQFAIMGKAFAKIILHINDPRIGLLNIGTEDSKGNETVKSAYTLIKESDAPMNFCGYIEGNDIAEGSVDVIVTDGFSGNIALKTAEGTSKMCVGYLKRAVHLSILSKIGFWLAGPAIKKSMSQLDHRLYNGAMLLGLNGIVIKSHGSSECYGFATAISTAIQLAAQDINKHILQEIISLDAPPNTK